MEGPTKYIIATAIALLFHVSGFLGMITGNYSEWFIRMTPVNLCVMLGLLLWTNNERTKKMYGFAFLAFCVGMITEMIGVNTGLLFGEYRYGSLMGTGIMGVPFLIGVNWFLVVWCSAQCMIWVHESLLKWMGPRSEQIPERWLQFSLIIDSALLATLFDWFLEPAAVKLGYWTWLQGSIPFFNYLCWFIISALLMLVFQQCGFKKVNQFAVHLFIIQILFFFAIRIFYTP
jgi:putative membrane protein